MKEEENHLSFGVGWAECVHSVLQRDGMDGGTAAGRPAGGTGGSGCPGSGRSSPAEQEVENQNSCLTPETTDRSTSFTNWIEKQKVSKSQVEWRYLVGSHLQR